MFFSRIWAVSFASTTIFAAEINITDDGSGTGTTTWTSNNTYILNGFVFVNDGDSLTIEGGNPRQAILDTHDDHRMAMSLGLIGLRVKNVQIRDEEVVGKSFPTYWQYLEQLGYSLVNI